LVYRVIFGGEVMIELEGELAFGQG
jgi:hypothetical protein